MVTVVSESQRTRFSLAGLHLLPHHAEMVAQHTCRIGEPFSNPLP